MTGPATGEIPSTFLAPPSSSPSKSEPSKDFVDEGGEAPRRPTPRRSRRLSGGSTCSARELRSPTPKNPSTPLSPSTPKGEHFGTPSPSGRPPHPEGAAQPTPPVRRRQLPVVPIAVAGVRMRDRAGPHPSRTPPDRASYDARRSPYGNRVSQGDYPAKSPEFYQSNEEGHRRATPTGESPRNQKDFLRNPDISRSQHANISQQRPRSLRLPNDMSPGDIYGPGGPPPSHNFRGPPTGHPYPPHQHPANHARSPHGNKSQDSLLQARHSAPEYPSTSQLAPPVKPNRAVTLPRRPHSTHGDLDASNYGSLPRQQSSLEKIPKHGSSSEILPRQSSDSRYSTDSRHSSDSIPRPSSGSSSRIHSNSDSNTFLPRHSTNSSPPQRQSSNSESFPHPRHSSGGSLSRQHSGSDSKQPPDLNHIKPQPKHDAPTTVNQILFGTQHPRQPSYASADRDLSPTRPPQRQREEIQRSSNSEGAAAVLRRDKDSDQSDREQRTGQSEPKKPPRESLAEQPKSGSFVDSGKESIVKLLKLKIIF